ncbi:SUF system NifU family Fe-S cluster assembly protein [Kineosporia sp. J2-2]|uniref:SUF system NifU family Fe-S cluster assembly protein n=1 Tax=Kineosporia corallincola TaxID=2835133 RepID=A0ABS5TMU4_9ACTN|nr:SUF system NifU family Fe-S cluster assembly protein [Kineosporia corallincola]MBT0772415.1 SUF system NifU family Fe-S cluster assembly protein [Kineosporia corallincola]
MSSLEALYQQVILDHSKEKHGRVALADEPVDPASGTARSHQYNPLCGDEVTVELTLGGSTVSELAWTGDGCSISQAATSVMHDLVVGKPVGEARDILADYRTMLRSRGEGTPDEEVLGDAVAFAGVSRHANRVKCAILGWTAFEDALLRIEAARPQPGDQPGIELTSGEDR